MKASFADEAKVGVGVNGVNICQHLPFAQKEAAGHTLQGLSKHTVNQLRMKAIFIDCPNKYVTTLATNEVQSRKG